MMFYNIFLKMSKRKGKCFIPSFFRQFRTKMCYITCLSRARIDIWFSKWTIYRQICLTYGILLEDKSHLLQIVITRSSYFAYYGNSRFRSNAKFVLCNSVNPWFHCQELCERHLYIVIFMTKELFRRKGEDFCCCFVLVSFNTT